MATLEELINNGYRAPTINSAFSPKSFDVTSASPNELSNFIDSTPNYDYQNLLDIGDTGMPWYKDKSVLGAGAGLASALTSLAALPSQMKLAKMQSKALKQNIDFARQEQNRRNQNISSFNSFQYNRPPAAAAPAPVAPAKSAFL